MKNVRFLRPAPYDYLLPSGDLYTSYNTVAKNDSEPAIDPLEVPSDLKELALQSSVICSDASRTRQTAQSLGSDFVVCSQLHEIGYTMEQLISHEVFLQLSSAVATTKARKLFFPTLFENGLSESYKDALSRVVLVLELLMTYEGNVIAVSHGFFMKFVEIAVLYPHVVGDINLFQKYYSGAKPAFAFLDGPSFTAEQIARSLPLLRKKLI